MSIEDPPLPRDNPRPVTPDRDPDLIVPLVDPLATLAEQLGSVVDHIRQDINVDLGLRPYRVFSVVTKWAGGKIGYGTPDQISREELLPRPRVIFETKLDSLKDIILSSGKQDTGLVTVDRVSQRYTEEDIQALFPMQPLPEGLQAHIEIGVDQRDGETRKRRFVLATPPWRDAKNFQWRLIVRDQAQSFTRTGRPQVLHTPEEIAANDPTERGNNWWQQ